MDSSCCCGVGVLQTDFTDSVVARRKGRRMLHVSTMRCCRLDVTSLSGSVFNAPFAFVQLPIWWLGGVLFNRRRAGPSVLLLPLRAGFRVWQLERVFCAQHWDSNGGRLPLSNHPFLRATVSMSFTFVKVIMTFCIRAKQIWIGQHT